MPVMKVTPDARELSEQTANGRRKTILLDWIRQNHIFKRLLMELTFVEDV